MAALSDAALALPECWGCQCAPLLYGAPCRPERSYQTQGLQLILLVHVQVLAEQMDQPQDSARTRSSQVWVARGLLLPPAGWHAKRLATQMRKRCPMGQTARESFKILDAFVMPWQKHPCDA